MDQWKRPLEWLLEPLKINLESGVGRILTLPPGRAVLPLRHAVRSLICKVAMANRQVCPTDFWGSVEMRPVASGQSSDGRRRLQRIETVCEFIPVVAGRKKGDLDLGGIFSAGE